MSLQGVTNIHQACVQVWAPWATVQLCESPHVNNSILLPQRYFLIIGILSQDWPRLWAHKSLQWQSWQDGNTYHTGNAAVAAVDVACSLQELWKALASCGCFQNLLVEECESRQMVSVPCWRALPLSRHSRLWNMFPASDAPTAMQCRYRKFVLERAKE